jgi:hypothetical protein
MYNNNNSTIDYPKYTDHQEAWEELAKGISSIKGDVGEVEEGSVAPNSKVGELIIIGSGIETIGVSLGDKRLIEDADKVLFCVADPATIVWLKRLRPDALDLYVLYGENKVRYTTYMQMTEAQLYWVRQGKKVVVVFYGHPGVFVLSTHRAIKLARREGYKATMKAGVCALDTLCADLGVDPCHPGLQTHEATDCLIRQRKLDPSLHVILWQVGLIGELGYRRQGYLNSNFSYFIKWLQSIYSDDYEITHYIGSRYPTIEPLIEIYKLSELHEPEIQIKITGLSTFYLPPRDVVPSDLQTVKDLGVIKEGQRLVVPKSPLREIGLYGPREMKAFEAFSKFRIPPSYKWQNNTPASNFLIELRFDTELQDLYLKNPLEALNDSRFSELSDRERSLLASRDSGAIQIASKGAYHRSITTENALTRILTKKSSASSLLRKIAGVQKNEAREEFDSWVNEHDFEIEWSKLHYSIDFINRNNMFPWTGVYVDEDQERVVTIIGNQNNRNKSIIYVNDIRVKKFTFNNGVIKWKINSQVPFNGFIRPDIDMKFKRRIIGKIWNSEEPVSQDSNFVAYDVDPQRKTLAAQYVRLYTSSAVEDIYGTYAVRTNGRFSKFINWFTLSESGLVINDEKVESYDFENGKLSWTGGSQECYAGTVNLLIDPIINSIELYGSSTSNQEDKKFKCYGSLQFDEKPQYQGPSVPEWAEDYLAEIAFENGKKGGLLFWHKWEKQNFTSLVMNKYISSLI